MIRIILANNDRGSREFLPQNHGISWIQPIRHRKAGDAKAKEPASIPAGARRRDGLAREKKAAELSSGGLSSSLIAVAIRRGDAAYLSRWATEPRAAWAAARRAMGTRKGEQET